MWPGGLDGGHVGRLILRLSEEEQRQRKVEAPEGLFQMARYVLKKKRPENRIPVTSMERESHSVSLSCNFKLSSNSTFPILYSFQAAPVACDVWSSWNNITFSMFQVGLWKHLSSPGVAQMVINFTGVAADVASLGDANGKELRRGWAWTGERCWTCRK